MKTVTNLNPFTVIDDGKPPIQPLKPIVRYVKGKAQPPVQVNRILLTAKGRIYQSSLGANMLLTWSLIDNSVVPHEPLFAVPAGKTD
jgi:hypothetical protein